MGNYFMIAGIVACIQIVGWIAAIRWAFRDGYRYTDKCPLFDDMDMEDALGLAFFCTLVGSIFWIFIVPLATLSLLGYLIGGALRNHFPNDNDN